MSTRMTRTGGDAGPSAEVGSMGPAGNGAAMTLPTETARTALDDLARELRSLQAVGQARAVVVALVIDEDLGLVGQPSERRRVDDAIAVALEGGAEGMARLVMNPPPAVGRVHGEGAEVRLVDGAVQRLHDLSLSELSLGGLSRGALMAASRRAGRARKKRREEPGGSS